MGTITIEEYGNTGAVNAREVTIPDLSKQTGRQTDATTSTSAESFTLAKNTRVVKVYTSALHRVSMVDATAATTYAYCMGDGTNTTSTDFGALGGETLYYRLDA